MVYRPRGLYESDSSPCDVNKGKFEDNEGVSYLRCNRSTLLWVSYLGCNRSTLLWVSYLRCNRSTLLCVNLQDDTNTSNNDVNHRGLNRFHRGHAAYRFHRGHAAYISMYIWYIGRVASMKAIQAPVM
jgi:hypothetical protein